MFVNFIIQFVKMRLLIRSALILILVSFGIAVSGRTYYVAPNGINGSYPSRGTLSNPWATLQWAFDNVTAGDTVYLRGGVYPITASQKGSNLHATESNPIVIMAYPDDYFTGKTPILDGAMAKSFIGGAILLSNSSWIHLEGITIRNLFQISPASGTEYDHPIGFYSYLSSNITIKNCKAYDIGYRGFFFYEPENSYVIDCDAWNIADTLSDDPGDHGDGFMAWDGGGEASDTLNYILFDGCRAWNCSDDGFDIEMDGVEEVVNCWSFSNGYLEFGSGSGFKIGYPSQQRILPGRLMYNNVAAFNKAAGWSTNDANYSAVMPQLIYNNTSYHNTTGFGIFDTNVGDSYELMRVYMNNLAYANTSQNVLAASNAAYTQNKNSWDISGLTLSDDDFISVDSTGITAPRQADGSFPDNNCYKYFLKLAPGSDLIDAGVDVGLQYISKAPDLGAFESFESNPDLAIVTNIIVTGAGGASSITTNTGSLQLSTAILPSNATNKSVTWSIANGTGQATISSSGLVTAIANGTVTARATANDGSGVSGTLLINISNQIVRVSSITITGAGGATSITTNSGSLQLSSAILPSNATNKSVTWSIANGTGQATISSSGLVTAIANGTVTARATANDGSGAFGTLVITISNQVTPENQPPTITISSPTKSTSYITPATIIIEAAASDPDGTLRKVEFYQGTTRLGELTTAPYSFIWKEVPEGTYSITAAATDNQNLRTISGAVTVVVEKSANLVNELPIVSIKSPNKDKKIKKNDNVLIEVIATDPDGTISKVELKNGEITLAELTTPPFNYLWENVDTGNYSLSAIATDDQGAKNISSVLVFEVVDIENSNLESIKLYPNPNNGDFSVALDIPLSDSKNIVSIVSLTGKSVYYDTWKQDEIMKHFSLPGLLPGTYILLIQSGDGIMTSKKFIKK